MEKPDGLPHKTSVDHDFLLKYGWRFIGQRKAKYGPHFYWDRLELDGSRSKQYLQGTAVRLQKRLEKCR